MALNPDKSHIILFGTAQRARSFSGLQSIDVAGSITPLDSHIKLLWSMLDSHVSMSENNKLMSQSCFYHIQALHHIMWCVRSPHCHSHSLSLDLWLT